MNEMLRFWRKREEEKSQNEENNITRFLAAKVENQ